MILEITERCEWTAILRSVDSHDFYHTFDYHKLCESSGDRSVLLVYRERSALIAVPLVIRAIPGTDLRDATSVYGYPGPLSSRIPIGFDSSRFRSELTGYFHDSCIVSVFSRLNPYIKGQRHILDGIGDLNIAGQVVGIDLGMSALQQRERFSRSLKTQLNRARRETLVREGTGREDIAKFCDIYRESMDRLGAKDDYYYTMDYFTGLFASPQIDAKLLLAVCAASGETMAGSIFTVSADIVQYHLGGTLTRFMGRMPSKLLIDEMRIGQSDGNRSYFNLGGGVGCDNDNLFYFKRRFSPDVRSFIMWRFIVDRERYNELVRSRTSIGDPGKDSFPEYRDRDKMGNQ